MLKSLLTADSPLSCINLEEKAKKSGFIKRKSKKLSASGILFALMKCVITGKGSFNQIATQLKELELTPMRVKLSATTLK